MLAAHCCRATTTKGGINEYLTVEINEICTQQIALKKLETARCFAVSATYSLVASRNMAICRLM